MSDYMPKRQDEVMAMLSNEFKEMIAHPLLHQLNAPITGEYSIISTVTTDAAPTTEDEVASEDASGSSTTVTTDAAPTAEGGLASEEVSGSYITVPTDEAPTAEDGLASEDASGSSINRWQTLGSIAGSILTFILHF